MVWKKLAIDCGDNACCSITRCSLDQWHSLPAGVQLAYEIRREVCAVANAKGIHLGAEDLPEPVCIPLENAVFGGHLTSMLNDVLHLERTEYRKIYLDAAARQASYEPYAQHSEVVYDPNTETAVFDMKFDEETEITGYIKLHLYVECRGHDNMDLFPWVKKLGQNGEFIPIHCMGEPFRGAWGYFRCSHRELDPKWSTDFQPVQAHRKEEPMEPGKIYAVDIEFYPHSRIWHTGETLRLEIQGRFIHTEWFEDGHMVFDLDNGNGKHVIHTGGQYGSCLQISFLPPKYQSGAYVYR